MKLFGQFRDINADLCTVEIITSKDPFSNSSSFVLKARAEAEKLANNWRRLTRGYDSVEILMDDDLEHDEPAPDNNRPNNESSPDSSNGNSDSSTNNPSTNDSSTNDPSTNEDPITQEEIDDSTPDYWIGENGIWFAGDPFTIECEAENTFEHIIKHTATLRLVVSKYIGELVFSTDARQNKIRVKRGDKVLFDGFITMNIYNQPYNTDADMVEIECVDKLSTLNQYKYKNTYPENYLVKAASSSTVSFLSVLEDALSGLSGEVWYDSTKSIDGSTYNDTLSKIGIGEQIFFGDDFEGLLDKEEALRQMLQYVNLHIVQDGSDFYLFDWMSLRGKATPEWVGLRYSKTYDASVGTNIDLTGDMHMASDTNISIGDVYSQVQVNCDLEEAEDLLSDFFDEDNLYSKFSNMQLYMTEYSSLGEGETALDCFKDMVNDKSNTYHNGTMIDWYVQAMENKNWVMNPNDPIEYTTSSAGLYINQAEVIDRLAKKTCRAGLFKIGNIKRKASELTNADPVSQIKMSNYLYISVNGNEEKTQSRVHPSDSEIDDAEPVVLFKGNEVSGSFSPADEETTNYIVFAGKMLLQPIQKESIVFNEKQRIFKFTTTVPSDDHEDGKFYARKWYKFLTPKDDNPAVTGWTSSESASYKYSKLKKYVGAGLMMPTEDHAFNISDKVDEHEDPFEYSHSEVGDSTDQIFKIPILECEMRIGDKKLVEWWIDADGHSKFLWVRDGEEPDLIINGKNQGRKATTFTLGINPKIGDVILGTEFDIQNTISFKQNIDATGTAIPVTKDDALTGNVEFKILGPCNTMWNQVVRIHPSFWRHTSWKKDYLPILAFTENIIIKDFSCKIYSDNAGEVTSEDNDLMYVAQETDYNFNNKQEIDFSIVTQLDSRTAQNKGIKAGVYTNGVVNLTTNQPLEVLYTKKYGTTVKRKAEEHYAYDYLEEWRKPAVVMTTTLKDDSTIDFKNTYYSYPLNKKFMVQSIARSVKTATATLKLKEITA